MTSCAFHEVIRDMNMCARLYPNPTPCLTPGLIVSPSKAKKALEHVVSTVEFMEREITVTKRMIGLTFGVRWHDQPLAAELLVVVVVISNMLCTTKFCVGRVVDVACGVLRCCSSV